ncbi:MAG TPA: S9 family peptidase [Gemmatimonadales bacterium]|nr:S9 family peptidase [Gemmatimonadales bacterium]
MPLLRAGFVTLLAAAPAAAQQRPMSVEDLLAVQVAGDPQISPDGRLVAFTVSEASLDSNRNISRIWVVPASGGEPRQVTKGPGSDRAPRWAPDSRSLAFISTRERGSQVWRVRLDGNDLERLTTLPGGVNDFTWSPDGRYLFLVSDVKWPATQEIDRRNGAFPTQARIWTSLLARHWNEWRAGTRTHLFRQSLPDGRVTDLTPIDRDVPTIALGGRDVALAALGTELAVVFNPDPEPALSTNNDIFVMGPDGTARQPITTSPANDHSPSYSPDGRYIAYLAMEVPGFESDRQHIVLYERATGRRSPLTGSWDRSVAAIRWMPHSRSLVAEVEERGERVLYAVDVPSGRTSRLVGGGVNSDVQVSPAGDFLVFLRQSATAPAELYRVDAAGRGLRALTRLNAPLLARLDLSPAEPFGFVGAANDSVFGWIVRPPDFSSRRRYPVVYLIHGGPQSAWLDQWHARWNYALFASRGYVVAGVNFHGSTGYGRRFTNSISRNWGGLPYEDLMKGLDHLSRLPYVDTTRMGAAGASYGGYMIYWMAGHTGRFRALVAHDGVFNPLSMAGSTEELWFPHWEFGGSQLSPSARATMEKWSPANFVSRWSTPLLVVHSQNDFRVDVSEGFQAFTAARLRNLPAKFLYFPDEDHFVTKPRNRRLWWGTVLDWFDTHLAEPAT